LTSGSLSLFGDAVSTPAKPAKKAARSGTDQPDAKASAADAPPLAKSTSRSASAKKGLEKPAMPSAPAVAPLFHPFRGYRVTQEDGCEAEVRASVGRFYPFDGDTVAFDCLDTNLARQIRRKFPQNVEIFAQGDEETTFHLPASLYPQIAGLAGVQKRAARSVSP
jgi:hypothetical protein